MRPHSRFLQRLARRLDELLAPHEQVLGAQYRAYRNHACRVAALHGLLAGTEGDVPDAVLVAAAYHDVGLWTAGSFDYIAPSMRLAAGHLALVDRPHLGPEVAAMIRDHHKVRPCGPDAPRSAELFRRADWIDVTRGGLRFGLTAAVVCQVRRSFPTVGFHCFLLRTAAGWLVKHPFNPLPMVRW